MWAAAQDPSQVQFSCSWPEVHPAPRLRWEGGHHGAPWTVYVSEMADALTVTLNHSQLSNGKTVKCVAEHVMLRPGDERSCSFTLSEQLVRFQ